MPAIFLTSQATQSNSSSSFGGFVGYIGREDAFKIKDLSEDEIKNIIVNDNNTNQSFKNYIFYQKNSLKSNGLFDNENNLLTQKQQRQLVKKVNEAEKNGSPLFQDVVSFDNKFLEQMNIYNSKTGALNESKIQNAIRKGMNNMLKAENFEAGDNTIWAAAIHRNTDNIHVHIATTELHSKRPIMNNHGKKEYRVKRKLNNIKAMKRDILHEVSSNDFREKEIGLLKSLDKQDKRIRNIFSKGFEKDDKKIKSIVKSLPIDKQKEWRFRSNADDMKPAQKEVNNYVDEMLKGDLKPNYEVFLNLINQQESMYRDLYGEISKNHMVKDKRLKEKMANSVYKTIKDEVKNVENNLDNKNNPFDKNVSEKIKDLSVKKTKIKNAKKRKDELKKINAKLATMTKNNKFNKKEFISLKNRSDYLKLESKSYMNQSNDEKIFIQQKRMDNAYKELNLKNNNPVNKYGFVNYDDLKNPTNKQIEKMNDYINAKNNRDSLKIKKSLYNNKNSIYNKLNKNFKKLNNKNLRKNKKQKIYKQIDKLNRNKTINNLNLINERVNSKNVKHYNHYMYRAMTIPEFKYSYLKNANTLKANHINNLKKQKEQINKVKFNFQNNEHSRGTSFYKTQLAKNKILQSPKRLKNLSSKLKNAGKSTIVNNNQVEREEYKIMLEQYKNEKRIQQSIYDDNSGRSL